MMLTVNKNAPIVTKTPPTIIRALNLLFIITSKNKITWLIDFINHINNIVFCFQAISDNANFNNW